MPSRVRGKDLIGGLGLALLGFGVAFRALSYGVGTLQRMGPGYLPVAVGTLLGLVGLAIASVGILGPRRAAVLPAGITDQPATGGMQWRAWLLICASLVAFILLTKHLGLVPGAFGIVFLSALADRENRWPRAATLAAVMTGLCILVFWWGLRVQLPLFAWL